MSRIFLRDREKFADRVAFYRQGVVGRDVPYGAERIKSGTADLDRTFIGQFGDDPSALSYLNARYYDSARGVFTAQDPVYLAIGAPNEIRRLARYDQGKLLFDPQLMNSYNYGRSNPLPKRIPTAIYT